MIEGRGGAGFLLETAQAIRIRGDIRRQDLEGDPAVETDVPRLVNLAHPPAPSGERIS